MISAKEKEIIDKIKGAILFSFFTTTSTKVRITHNGQFPEQWKRVIRNPRTPLS